MSCAFLIGFRGAGKSTLGRAFCLDAGWDFLDLDEVWEAREGRSILDFVEEAGLEEFRASEEKLLRETIARLEHQAPGRSSLVATGGGVVDWAPSLRALEESKIPKIWLLADSEMIWSRLENNPERRKIGGLKGPAEVAELLARRRPAYEKIATYRLENRDITQALVELKQMLGPRPVVSTNGQK